MRILQVSAHYPPNFISGGSLVPQSLAHSLVHRGHQVAVFAGAIDRSRKPLEVWHEVDPAGVEIFWVATTPFLSWSDKRNWNNDGAVGRFEDVLDRVKPEIAHFHSLQGLGAGLLSAAARLGVRTVVTSHDFWWQCARQFLVNTALKPCCPVVDAGNCPCEVDHEWLLRRNRQLQAELSTASLILAPSRSALSVLAANGVPSGKLAVNENGLVSTPSLPHRPSRAGDDIVYIFAGGSNPLKGINVLSEAVKCMPSAGWRLTCFGVEPLDVDLLPGSERVAVRPPFAPADRQMLLVEGDVLVVPSLMRESYSMLTREALALGLAVISSDCLGPEEVVIHEHNGLIVPTGDALALGQAMQRLSQDRGLLRQLQENAEDVGTKGLSSQVDDLERMYLSLVAQRPGRESGARISSVAFLSGIDGAPVRYRAHLPAEALRLRGVKSYVRHYRESDAGLLARRADVLVLYRVPITRQIVELTNYRRARGLPSVFSVDDLVFDPELAAEIPALQILGDEEAALWLDGVRRYRATLDLCDGFIGSTQVLCGEAERLTGIPSYLLPNGVGLQLARLSDQAISCPGTRRSLRIGYFSGTTTHDRDWATIEGAVARVLGRHPDVELVLAGYLKTGEALEGAGRQVVRLPFMPWTSLPAELRNVDVNLAPLEANMIFNEAKSAIKWLEAALVEVPTIATPTEPYRAVIRHGHNGMLARTEEEWESAIQVLLGDEGLRRRLGRRARRDALLEFSPYRQAERLMDILVEVSAKGPRRGAHVSTAAAPDEPPLPIRLEKYQVGVYERPQLSLAVRRAFSTANPLLRAGVLVLRNEGVAEALLATVRYMRGRLAARGGS